MTAACAPTSDFFDFGIGASGKINSTAEDSSDSSSNAEPTANSNGEGGGGAFVVPDYEPESLVIQSTEVDVSAVTSLVLQRQSLGKNLAAIAEKNGRIVIDEATTVQLTKISQNQCPSTVQGCDENDSEKLGVPSSSFISSPDEVATTVQQQGDRGSCVAFALTGAVEHMFNAQDVAVDLSEQHVYFNAKKATDSWWDEGLVPSLALEKMTTQLIPITEEKHWPYNPKAMSCSDYLAQNPGFTCSETIAQGGGQDDREVEPRARDHRFAVIEEAHQLYASIGRVKQALAQGFPVVLSINANRDFQIATRKAGVVSWVSKQPGCSTTICGHAVLAIGYHDDPAVEGGGYVVVKNSWGAEWGARGLGYLTYRWLENSILDAQAVAKATTP